MRLFAAAVLSTIVPLGAIACSCMSSGPFSDKLPDRTNLSVAVFTAEAIRFDPVAAPPAVPAKANQENRASVVRPNYDPVNAKASGPPLVNFERMNRKIVFRISETFSGPDPAPAELWTHSQSSACGFEFVVGKKYLVEAQLWPPDQPRWTVNKCLRTTELGTGLGDEQVRVLQLWKAGKRPPSWVRGRLFGFNETSQIAGVRLQLTDGKVTRFAQSGADGVYYFGDLVPGVYTLTADLPGSRNRTTVDLREQWSAGPAIYVGFPN